ncbi:glycosyltransferase family 2 protein [Pseudomonas profundi]|uniref:glycosyltransferase family 2 protein n=1 Tax=Pseudomonas profundi TaxID=1981513 RepID=UPI00123B1BD6|nr:glycosyltransferase family 2 protein [Pseudomonas profundi]
MQLNLPPCPLVSVLVPCFNYARYVGDAIASILQQDYPNFELVVVDDGSTDNSFEVINEAVRVYGKESLVRNVEVISQENAGVSAALNAGLARANGEFIATFDADDLMVPGRLGLQVAYLKNNPSVGCLGGRAARIDEKGNLLANKIKDKGVSSYDFEAALACALVVGGNLAMYRREALTLVGGYDPDIKVQDFQMTLKVAHAGYRVDVLPDTITLYRKHHGSLSSQYRSELEYGLKLIELYKSYPGYESAKARLLVKAMRFAVTDDKSFAWSLLRQIPFKQWDVKTLKRVRYLLFKSEKRT